MALRKTSKKKRKKFFKRNRLTILVLCFLLAYLSITIIKQQVKMNSLLEEENKTIEKLQKLKKEARNLEKKIEESESMDFIEKTAREKLKMVKKNEIIYIIQEKE